MSGHGDAATPPRQDLIVAAVFFAFSTAVVSASLAMPTFTDQGTPLYVAPGVVPGFHGIVLGLLSVILGVRAVLRGALHPQPAAGPPTSSIRRIAIAAVLAIGFAVGLVGRLPFWLAASLFVFTFIMTFELRRGMARAALARNAALAAGIGLATGVGITLLFERVFLIRMP